MNRGTASEDLQIDEKDPTANPAKSCAWYKEKVVYIPKDTRISKPINETEDQVLEEPVRESPTLLMLKRLAAKKAEVHSNVRAAKSKVLRKIIEKPLRDILLDGHEIGEENAKYSSDQFMKYVLTHCVAVCTLYLFLAPSSDKLSGFKTFVE